MDDEIEDCPLCVEPFESADKLFEPCECGFQICMFCWKKIRETGSGTCPACRTPYGDAPRFRGGLDAAGLMAKQAELAAMEAARKAQEPVIKRTNSNSTATRSYSSTVAANGGGGGGGLSRTTSGPTTYSASLNRTTSSSASHSSAQHSLSLNSSSDSGITYTSSSPIVTTGSNSSTGKSDGSSPSVITKDTPITNINNVPPTILLSTGTVITKEQLRDIRVVQRNLIYVIGIPPNLGKESILKLPSYFGQYGKTIKIVVNRSTQNNGGDNGRLPSVSAYITYSKQSEALSAIIAMDGFWLNGQCLRACFGTTKYCNAWLRGLQCTTPDCLYLHELGLSSDSFSRSEMLSNSNTHGYNFAELVHPNYHFLNGNGVHGGIGGTSPATTVASCQANIDAAKAKGYVLPPVLSQFMGYVDGSVPLPSGPVHPVGKRRTNTTSVANDDEEDGNGEDEVENAVTGPIIVRSNSAPAASNEGSTALTTDNTSTVVYSQKRGTDGRTTTNRTTTTNPRLTNRTNTYTSATTAPTTTVSTSTTGPTTSTTNTTTTTTTSEPVYKDNIIPHTVYYGVTGIPPTPITTPPATAASLSLDSTEDFPALPGSTITRNTSSSKIIRSTTGSSGKTIAATISSTLKNTGIETATTPVTAPASWPALPTTNKETITSTNTSTKASSTTSTPSTNTTTIVDSRLSVKDKRYSSTSNTRSRDRTYPPTTSKYSSLPVTNIPSASTIVPTDTTETESTITATVTNTDEPIISLVSEAKITKNILNHKPSTVSENPSVTGLELPSSIETATLADATSVTDSLLSLSNTSSSLDSTILPGGNNVLLPTTVPSIMGDSLDLDALLRAPHSDSFGTTNSLLPNLMLSSTLPTGGSSSLAATLPTDLSHFNLGLTNDFSKDTVNPNALNNPLGSLNMDVSSLLLSSKDFNLNFGAPSNSTNSNHTNNGNSNHLMGSLGNLALNSSLNSLLTDSNTNPATNPSISNGNSNNNWNTMNPATMKTVGTNHANANGNNNTNNFSFNNLFGTNVSPTNNNTSNNANLGVNAVSTLGLGTDLLLNASNPSSAMLNGVTGSNNGSSAWLLQNTLPTGLMETNANSLLNLGLGSNSTNNNPMNIGVGNTFGNGNTNSANPNSLLLSLLPKSNQPSSVVQGPSSLTPNPSQLTPQQQVLLLQQAQLQHQQAAQQQQQAVQSANFAASLGLTVDPALLSSVLSNNNGQPNFNPAIALANKGTQQQQPTVSVLNHPSLNSSGYGPTNSNPAVNASSQLPPGFPPEIASLLMNSTPLQQQQILQQLSGNSNNNSNAYMTNPLSPGRPGTNPTMPPPGSQQQSNPQVQQQAQQQAFMQSLLLLQQQQQQQSSQIPGGNTNTLPSTAINVAPNVNPNSTANNNPNSMIQLQQLQRLQQQVQAAQVQAAQAQQRVASSLQNFQNIQLALQLQAVQAQAQAQRAAALQRQFSQVTGGQNPNTSSTLPTNNNNNPNNLPSSS